MFGSVFEVGVKDDVCGLESGYKFEYSSEEYLGLMKLILSLYLLEFMIQFYAFVLPEDDSHYFLALSHPESTDALHFCARSQSQFIVSYFFL